MLLLNLLEFQEVGVSVGDFFLHLADGLLVMLEPQCLRMDIRSQHRKQLRK
jgi:hypothetical protein